ncbi:MAG: MFS transporter [Verrucomicrobiales bacterium]
MRPSPPLSANPPFPAEAEVGTCFTRRNYWVFVAEGGFFMGGLALVSADTVLPVMVTSLGGDRSLLAFLPMLMWFGILLPSIFVSHRVEALPVLKPFIVWCGLWQRLTFLFAAAALYLWGQTNTTLALGVVMLTPFLSGLFGGIGLSAWFTLSARTVSPQRRSSATALKQIMGALMGLLGGFLVERVLSTEGGVQGFALLHLLAFVAMAFSLAAYLLTQEAPAPPFVKRPDRGILEFFHGLPQLVRSFPLFARYVVGRTLGASQFFIVPFMMVQALAVTGQEDALAGIMLSAQMAGGIAGNVTAGILGDRFGGKGVALFARLLFIVMLFMFWGAHEVWHFTAVFVVWGFVFQAMMVSDNAVTTELAHGRRMPSLMALNSFAYLIGLVGVSVSASLLSQLSEGIFILLCLSGGLMLLGFIVLLSIPEPRNNPLTQASNGRK